MNRLAVITGATSGIGAELARQLAPRCDELWLVGRRAPELAAVAREIEQQHRVSCRVLLLDLSQTANIDGLARELEQQDGLEFLVNNAGYADDGRFHDMPWRNHDALLKVHVDATVKLSHSALQVMNRRGRGGIINLASVASWLVTPSSPLYGPTKAFIRSFSQMLAATCNGTDIRVQALCPGFTVTDFHQRMGIDPDRFYRKRGLIKSWSARFVVRESLRDLERGKPVSVPGWNYKLIVFLLRHMPLWALQRMATSGNRSHRPAT